MSNVLDCVSGMVEEANASKKNTGFNYRLAGKWFFADKSFPIFNVGDIVKVEYETSHREDGREAYFVKSIRYDKVVDKEVVKPVISSETLTLLDILKELKEIKALLKTK